MLAVAEQDIEAAELNAVLALSARVRSLPRRCALLHKVQLIRGNMLAHHLSMRRIHLLLRTLHRRRQV